MKPHINWLNWIAMHSAYSQPCALWHHIESSEEHYLAKVHPIPTITKDSLNLFPIEFVCELCKFPFVVILSIYKTSFIVNTIIKTNSMKFINTLRLLFKWLINLSFHSFYCFFTIFFKMKIKIKYLTNISIQAKHQKQFANVFSV